MTASPSSFDVPEWVASLAGCTRGEVVFSEQTEANDMLVTRYVCRGDIEASVELMSMPLPGGRRGTWQLVARVGAHHGGAQLPAHTRFAWH
jgi:hypothetical protein